MYGERHFEVVVVGAGPVGLTTALLLAKQGIQTGVIDREPGPARRSYACALHPRSLEILDAAGVLPPLLAAGHQVESLSFYEDGLRQGGLDFTLLQASHPYVLVLPQSTLESVLAETLKKNSNVKLLWNHRLTDLEVSAVNVTARVDRLAKSAQGYAVPEVEWETDVSLEFPAKYLIGADGYNSHVRRCLGIEYERVGAPARYAVFEMESVASTGSEMKVVMHDDTASVMWPFGGNRCRWGFQIDTGNSPGEEREKERVAVDVMEEVGDDDSLHRLRHLLNERVPWFDLPVHSVNWSAEIQFETRLARNFSREHCWLVGDAAHQTGPVGMKSMNLGLSEGADLANRLAGVFRGHLESAPLLSYDSIHRAEWRRLLGIDREKPVKFEGTDWVSTHAEAIPAMVPASGEHLIQLLSQLHLVGQT